MTTEELPDIFEWVRTFNTTGNQTVRDEEELFIPLPERLLRFRLVAEEIDELVEKGFNDLDIVEVADGLADIVYVAVGAGLTHGFRFPINRTDSEFQLDLVKDKLMRDAYAERMRDLVLGLFEVSSPSENGTDQCVDCGKENCRLENVKAYLQDIVYNCYLIAASYGINLDKVLAEVQASNMSKFGKSETPGGKRKVYRDDNGKVMKGPDYFKADIPQVLRDQGMDLLTVGGWNASAADLNEWPHFEGKPLPYLATVTKSGKSLHVFMDQNSESESWKLEGGGNCVRDFNGNYPEWIETKPVDAPVLAAEESRSVPMSSKPTWVQGDETPTSQIDSSESEWEFVTEIPSQVNGKTIVNIGEAYGTAYVFLSPHDTPLARVLWQS